MVIYCIQVSSFTTIYVSTHVLTNHLCPYRKLLLLLKCYIIVRMQAHLACHYMSSHCLPCSTIPNGSCLCYQYPVYRRTYITRYTYVYSCSSMNSDNIHTSPILTHTCISLIHPPMHVRIHTYSY